MKYIKYMNKKIPVYGGAWSDVMNSCLYTVIDKLPRYDICKDNANGEIFALPAFN